MGDLPLPSWAICRTDDGHSADPIMGGLPLLQPIQQAMFSKHEGGVRPPGRTPPGREGQLQPLVEPQPSQT